MAEKEAYVELENSKKLKKLEQQKRPIAEKIGSALKQLLINDGIRYLVSAVRYFYFVKLRRSLKIYSGEEAVAGNTVQHNLKSLGTGFGALRTLKLIRPLTVIGQIQDRIGDVKLLSIGPRSEGEILALIGHGFELRNIDAVDLISYSPWISVGDMHKLPYADNSFDAIICGWVLAYSDSKQKAVDELIRVTKDNGIIAIGVAFSLDDAEHKEIGYVPGSTERIRELSAIYSLFGNSIDQIYFSQDPVKIRGPKPNAMLSIFSIKK